MPHLVYSNGDKCEYDCWDQLVLLVQVQSPLLLPMNSWSCRKFNNMWNLLWWCIRAIIGLKKERSGRISKFPSLKLKIFKVEVTNLEEQFENYLNSGFYLFIFIYFVIVVVFLINKSFTLQGWKSTDTIMIWWFWAKTNILLLLNPTEK